MDASRHLLVGRIRGHDDQPGGDIVLKQVERDGQRFTKIYQRDAHAPIARLLFRFWDRVAGNKNLTEIAEGKSAEAVEVATQKLPQALRYIAQRLNTGQVFPEMLKSAQGGQRSLVDLIKTIDAECKPTWSTPLTPLWFAPGELAAALKTGLPIAKDDRPRLETMIDWLDLNCHRPPDQPLGWAEACALESFAKYVIEKFDRQSELAGKVRVVANNLAVIGADIKTEKQPKVDAWLATHADQIAQRLGHTDVGREIYQQTRKAKGQVPKDLVDPDTIKTGVLEAFKSFETLSDKLDKHQTCKLMAIAEAGIFSGEQCDNELFNDLRYHLKSALQRYDDMVKGNYTLSADRTGKSVLQRGAEQIRQALENR